jgi:hypothetical protein
VKSDAPGPGQYNPDIKGNGGVSFGKEPRQGKLGGADAPGPGQYSTDTPKKGGISFGMRHSLNKPDLGPGPGQYNPAYDPKQDKGPAYSIGGRPKDALGNDLPGPGNYNPDINKVRSRAPGAAMGSGPR